MTKRKRDASTGPSPWNLTPSTIPSILPPDYISESKRQRRLSDASSEISETWSDEANASDTTIALTDEDRINFPAYRPITSQQQCRLKHDCTSLGCNLSIAPVPALGPDYEQPSIPSPGATSSASSPTLSTAVNNSLPVQVYNDNADAQVRQIIRLEEITLSYQLLTNHYGVLGYAVRQQLSQMLDLPNGRDVIDEMRERIGVDPSIEWSKDDLLAGMSATHTTHMHSVLRTLISRGHCRLRQKKRQRQAEFVDAIRAPPGGYRDRGIEDEIDNEVDIEVEDGSGRSARSSTLLSNDAKQVTATLKNNTPAPRGQVVSTQRLRLTNLHRRSDGLFVVTIPNSQTLIAISPEMQIFVKVLNGPSMRLSGKMVRLFLSMLGVGSYKHQHIPSAEMQALQTIRQQISQINMEQKATLQALQDLLQGGTIPPTLEDPLIPPPIPIDTLAPTRKKPTLSLRDKDYLEISPNAPSKINLLERLTLNPRVMDSLCTHLSASSIIHLYSTSKLFNYYFTSNYNDYITLNIDNWCPSALDIFPPRCFGPLLVKDPRARPDPLHPERARIGPGLKWLTMVHHRLSIAREILALLEAKGLAVSNQESTLEVLLKMSFTMRLAGNGARIGLIHNKLYWSDDNLYTAWELITRLDMAFTDPLQKGNLTNNMRHYVLACRNLSAIHDALQGILDPNTHPRKDIHPVYVSNARLADEHVSATDGGVTRLPHPEPSIACGNDVLAHEGERHLETRVIRMDQLVLQEGYARRLKLQDWNFYHLLRGFAGLGSHGDGGGRVEEEEEEAAERMEV